MLPVRLRPVALLGLLCLVALSARAQTYETGKSYFDSDRYIEYIPGDMPLIISAPHGGMIRPADIPDRGADNPGCPAGKRIVNATDTDSDALAKELQQRFFATYGIRPYVILAHINRRKVDLNRDASEAACGNPAMERTWRNWHAFVQTAIAAATAKFGGALYIDLHGHGHARQRLELGYGLGATQLATLYEKSTLVVETRSNRDEEDDVRAQDSDGPHVTLAHVPPLKHGKRSLRDLVYGDDAFGTLVINAGLDAVPSKQNRYPEKGEPFFNGGYNVRRYTATDYPQVFGWQIETHRNARLPANRTASAHALMNALTEFMARNAQLD